MTNLPPRPVVVVAPDVRVTWPLRHHAVVPRGRLDRSRLVASLLVVVALFMIAYGFASANTGDRALEVTDPAIETVSPKPGDEQVDRHQTITIDLAPGHRGLLSVNGQEVGVYDIDNTGTTSSGALYEARFDAALNTVTFTPRDGATVESLPPGRNTGFCGESGSNM
jgi:hypothetical protein